MNVAIIRYILGYILKIEGLFLMLPSVVAAIYHEKEGFFYLGVGVFCIIFGILLSLKKPSDSVFYLKEGCVATALSWIFLSIFGAIPFSLTGEIPSYADALFETVSGFTTTGASILSDVEALSHCSLFWRSFTHWIGGMGVLVFLLAIVPMTGGSHMNLMRAESPGPSVGKLVPKVRYTARILYLIYLGLTILEFVLLLCGGMPVFDSMTTSFGTAGTGGFGIKNDSIAGYSSYIQWVVTVFMILFGINFNAYYLIIFRNVKKALCMEEVRCYLIIILVSTGIIFAQLLRTGINTFKAITDAAFQVSSIITTTGFSTVDFNIWPQTSKTILVMLMFVGACAGSTGGGIKVSRFIILVKSLVKELNSYIHPKSISKVKIEGKVVEHEIVRATNVYIITFVIIFTISVLAVSIEGKDLVTNFTAVAATINNIGPGLELVGPTQNFGSFTVFSKFILMFDMLAGRLELFPLLILFHPTLWKDIIIQQKRRSRRS
ncbi:MAG: TrkH family potassium uptake protein [Butyrivibrio sp.]